MITWNSQLSVWHIRRILIQLSLSWNTSRSHKALHHMEGIEMLSHSEMVINFTILHLIFIFHITDSSLFSLSILNKYIIPKTEDLSSYIPAKVFLFTLKNSLFTSSFVWFQIPYWTTPFWRAVCEWLHTMAGCRRRSGSLATLLTIRPVLSTKCGTLYTSISS